MKGIDDPMTLADIKVQSLIIKGIKKFWPNLTIVAEESQEFQGELEFDFNRLNPHILSDQYFLKGKKAENFNNEISIEDSVVWIDPLDGTLSYVKNELDAVTTLIGLSNNLKPVLGIIGHPYPRTVSNDPSKYEFDPQVYFGFSQVGNIFSYTASQLEQLQQNQQQQGEETL